MSHKVSEADDWPHFPHEIAVVVGQQAEGPAARRLLAALRNIGAS